MKSEAIFGGVSDRDEVETRWFCGNGAVRERKDGVFEVTVGGMLVGTYTRREPELLSELTLGLASARACAYDRWRKDQPQSAQGHRAAPTEM